MGVKSTTHARATKDTSGKVRCKYAVVGSPVTRRLGVCAIPRVLVDVITRAIRGLDSVISLSLYPSRSIGLLRRVMCVCVCVRVGDM